MYIHNFLESKINDLNKFIYKINNVLYDNEFKIFFIVLFIMILMIGIINFFFCKKK